MTFAEKLAASRNKKGVEQPQAARATTSKQEEATGTQGSASDHVVSEKTKMDKLLEELANAETALYKLKKAIMVIAKAESEV